MKHLVYLVLLAVFGTGLVIAGHAVEQKKNYTGTDWNNPDPFLNGAGNESGDRGGDAEGE